METTTYTHTKLVASDGYFLTQKADIDIRERVISSFVILGVNDSADNWHEITAEEAETYRKARAEANKTVENENEE